MNEEVELIGIRMLSTLPRDWVYRVMTLAQTREAFVDLLFLWRDAPSTAERDEVVATLQDLLDDHEKVETEPIRTRKDFERVYGDRRAFKEHIRRMVEERGGVSEVARRAGIPQPSLSRFLNSAAAPRSSTLLKLAEGLGVSLSRLQPSADEGDAEVFDFEDHKRGRYHRVALHGSRRTG